MNLLQFIAQNAQQEQEPQEAQQTQEVLPAAMVEMKADADGFISLKAQAEAAIYSGTDPEQILLLMICALFGQDSPQAAAVAELIEEARHPGGREMTIAALRQRRRLLKQQQKQHEEQIKDLAAEVESINKAERELFAAQGEAETLNNGLIEVATFCKALPGTAPKPEMITAAGELYARHKNNPVAMGLLYGSLAQIARKTYAAAGEFDLVQLQQLADLRAQVLGAIQ